MLENYNRKAIFTVFFAFALAGCALDDRLGPKPVLDASVAAEATNNKALLLNALAADAGYGGYTADYYEVMQAGFNFVDDQCRAYFDHLFFLDRGRSQVKSGLAAANQTTAAILGVTGAASLTLAVVAQAFGLASAATDIISGTYLYQLPPAVTQSFVEKQQLAFRDAAAASRSSIRSPTTAYYYIQHYLNLCLPPTIEAAITNQLTTAQAIAVSKGGGPLFSIETFGAPSPNVRQALTPIASSRAPLSKPNPPVAVNSPITQQLLPGDLHDIQVALCVNPTDGQLGPNTQAAIIDFFAGYNAGVDKSNQLALNVAQFRDTGNLTVKQLSILKEAADAASGKSCAERHFQNAVDVGKSVR